MRARRLLSLSVFKQTATYLAVGAIAAWLVGWALALQSLIGTPWIQVEAPRPVTVESSLRGYTHTEATAGIGALRRYWTYHDYAAFYGGGSTLHQERDDPTRRLISVWAIAGDGSWGRLWDIKGMGVSEQRKASGLEDARGWPALSQWCSFEGRGVQITPLGGGQTRSGTIDVKGGIALPPIRGYANAQTVRALPYRPIWSGLVFNTLFYATLLWGFVALLTGIRRLRRFSRGRCPRCAYDLAHDYRTGCPECGWRRNAPGARAAPVSS